MRTTLTIDDSIAQQLKQAAATSGKPFKQVVNELLRAGLQSQRTPARKPYQLTASAMGLPRNGANLDKALDLASTLEDAAIADKLEQRK